MPDFLVVVRTDGVTDVRFVNGLTLLDVKTKIRAALENGITASGGNLDRVQIGIVLLQDLATFDPTR